MQSVIIKREVNVPMETAWDIWDDYGNIDQFNPFLSGSHVLQESEVETTGLGCKRICEFKDGKNYLKEEIITYEPYQKLGIDIYASTLPTKEAKVDIEFNALDAYTTAVIFTLRFIPKMGFLGKLLSPLMKIQFSRLLGKMMDSFVEYALVVEKKS